MRVPRQGPWGARSVGLRVSRLKSWFHAWLLRVGKWRVTLAITALTVVFSVLLTGWANAVFMPHVPWEEWFYVALVVPALISPPVCAAVLSLLYQLAEARAALVTMAETDPLTGVGNRRHFIARAQLAMAEAVRQRSTLCIVLIDIDHFKRINDAHGHAIGDAVITAVADTCRQRLRAGDVFCRWGGEEFIVLLPGATLEVGCLLAERLRTGVQEARVEGVPGGVTISLGVAELSRDPETLDEAIAKADRWLYRAKDAGRNRVEPPAALAFAS